MQIGERLRKIRIERGLNQPAAAERIGIQQSYLSKIENNHSTPSQEILQRIEKAYEVNLKELLDDFAAINEVIKPNKTQDYKFRPALQPTKNHQAQQSVISQRPTAIILFAIGLILFLISLFVSQNSRTIYVTQTVVSNPHFTENIANNALNSLASNKQYQLINEINEIYGWSYYVVFGVSLSCFIVSLGIYLIGHRRQRKKATDLRN